MRIKHLLSLVALSLFVSISYAATDVMEDDGKTIVEGNTAYSVTGGLALDEKKDLRKATKINAEMVIIYTNRGLLDRAKTKLIKAQELNKDGKYDLAIVDYAAGYYYQAIGANSIAESNYKKAISNNPNDYQSVNFYAQFLCIAKKDYSQAQSLFDKSLFISTNDDMAQTLYMYSECMYKEGKLQDAVSMMQRSMKFRSDYPVARLRLAEMYFENKQYPQAYKIIYADKDNEDFFNNRRVLDMRLKLAELRRNKSEAAMIKLILASNEYNNDENIDDFFVPETVDLKD